MATVEKRGSTWCVRYRVRDEFGNLSNSKRKSGFPDRNSAMKFAAEIEQKANAGIDVHGDRLTCGELMEQWFDSKIGKIEQSTLVRYSQQIDRLKHHVIYTTVVRNLRKDSLQALIDDLADGDDTHGRISINTAIDYTNPFRFALKWAAREGLIPASPFDQVERQRRDRVQMTILSEEDVDDLIRTCRTRNPHFLIPLYLALYGGLCREEVAALTWEHVNFTRGTILIDCAKTRMVNGKTLDKGTKNKVRARTVSLPAFVMDQLKLERQPSGLVCTYALDSYAKTVKSIIRAANVERREAGRVEIPMATYHDLRHTHAAMLIALGVQAKIISERLGHASIKTTMDLYGYLMPGLQEGVADVLDQRWGT